MALVEQMGGLEGRYVEAEGDWELSGERKNHR